MSEKIKNSEQASQKPRDNLHLVKITFFFIGLARNIPWTFFVTANEYWMFKFRNTSLDHYDSEVRTDLQVEFSSATSITTQVADFVALVLTLIYGHKFKANFKIFGCISVMLASFVVLTIFIQIDTDSWQYGFFVLTMLFVALINATNSVFAMAGYSVISKFSPAYLALYLNGQGLASVLTACLQLLSLSVGVTKEGSAFIYFGCGILINALTLILLMVAVRHPLYRYKMKDFQDNQKGRMISFREAQIVTKKIWPSIAIMGLWTLTYNPVHPSVTALVVSQDEGRNEWGDTYFVPTTCFLVSAVGELIGRALATKSDLGLSGKTWTIVTFLRMFIFVPLLMLCNAKPRHYLPVVFPYDYQFIVIMLAFSLSNGYLLNLCSIIIPSLVNPEELEDAYHVYVVATGILLGVLSPLGLAFIKLL